MWKRAFKGEVLISVVNIYFTITADILPLSYFDNVMMKFMINNRTDAWKTSVNVLNVYTSKKTFFGSYNNGYPIKFDSNTDNMRYIHDFKRKARKISSRYISSSTVWDLKAVVEEKCFLVFPSTDNVWTSKRASGSIHCFRRWHLPSRRISQL